MAIRLERQDVGGGSASGQACTRCRAGSGTPRSACVDGRRLEATCPRGGANVAATTAHRLSKSPCAGARLRVAGRTPSDVRLVLELVTRSYGAVVVADESAEADDCRCRPGLRTDHEADAEMSARRTNIHFACRRSRGKNLGLLYGRGLDRGRRIRDHARPRSRGWRSQLLCHSVSPRFEASRPRRLRNPFGEPPRRPPPRGPPNAYGDPRSETTARSARLPGAGSDLLCPDRAHEPSRA